MTEKDFQGLIYMFLDLWSVVNTVAWSLIIITVIVDQAKTPAIPKFWKSDKKLQFENFSVNK